MLKEKHPTEDDIDRPTTAERRDADGPYRRLIAKLTDLRSDLDAAWVDIERTLPPLPGDNGLSAQNLVHYLALRRHDIRDLQIELARCGASSLGRAESHVMSTIERVIDLFGRSDDAETRAGGDVLDLDKGAEILDDRSNTLLGPAHADRKVRIMVTLPAEAADHYGLVRDLMLSGMDCARINCARDDASVWERMAENVKRVRKELGRECRLCFDIAGPKLRTGSFEPGPRVLRLRPSRDAFGRVTSPATVRLDSKDRVSDPTFAGDAYLQFPEDFLKAAIAGSKIKFKDTRGSSRKMIVRKLSGGELIGEISNSAYIVPGTEFRLKTPTGEKLRSTAGGIPYLEQYALVRENDTVLITGKSELGRPALFSRDGTLVQEALISSTLPEIFDHVRAGETIWFDDGKIGGIIESVGPQKMRVRITNAGPKGEKLRADKGINLPDTDLRLPSLTKKDLDDLAFIVKHADMIGYSFVNKAQDVADLQKKLTELGGEHLGIVLKIETRSAFDRLPEILLTALRSPTIGVMIARGDLAVETGFRRLAEVQEEILWMCEAAHVPVIWATQVLEQLSKKGIYSRAEITDAAMSERAECVMLNKGPFIVTAVRTLGNILIRMASHQDKKRALMRPLKLAKRFFKDY